MRRPCPKCGTWRYVTPEAPAELCMACRHAKTEAPDKLEHGAWVPWGAIRRWVYAKEKV